MFIYSQSVYDINLSYMEDEFEYTINCFGGKRRECGNRIEINTHFKPLPDLEIKLDFKECLLQSLKSLLKSVKRELKKANIKFSAVLTLHNESVAINDIVDHRYYGFLRLILKDTFNNVAMEDIPISRGTFDKLEDEVLYHIKHYTKIVNNKSLSKNKMLFNSIPVILSPQAAGFFIHEILGHLLEEDFYSFYLNNYKSLKASEKLTIYDSIENFAEIVGLNKYDDLGVPIKPLVLLERGKLVNILSINEDKSFDKKLYGAARRENYKHNIIPRMRGIFVLPHDNMSQLDILKQYSTAIFLNKSYLGSVDPSSGIYTLYGDGFYVKNGTKKNFISNLKLTGNIKNDLLSIDFVGNDFKMYGGYCVKLNQTIRVGMGGPTISLHRMAVEGDVHGKL